MPSVCEGEAICSGKVAAEWPAAFTPTRPFLQIPISTNDLLLLVLLLHSLLEGWDRGVGCEVPFPGLK